VAIQKPGGGERELGIPTVLDRFIQQALLQVSAVRSNLLGCKLWLPARTTGA
jgi:hypothetical protein